jgi:formylglycine-generating enzyme required for sulfatase activity
MEQVEKEEGIFKKMSKRVKAAIWIIALTAVLMEVSAQSAVISVSDMEFVLVEAGSFNTGEGGIGGTDVTLTEDFYIGRHEVKQSLYEKIMDDNPSSSYG